MRALLQDISPGCRCCPQELLAFISRYVYLLDHINQVTCLYRLAKLCYNSRGRSMFLQELQAAAPFRLLLRECSTCAWDAACLLAAGQNSNSHGASSAHRAIAACTHAYMRPAYHPRALHARPPCLLGCLRCCRLH